LYLCRGDIFFELFEKCLKLRDRTGVFGRKFDQNLGIRNRRFEIGVLFQSAFNAASLLNDLLRGLLIVPKSGLGDLFFKLR
jgi:hypothetical protein